MWPFGNRQKDSGIPLTKAVREKVAIVFDVDSQKEACEILQKWCGFSLPLMQTIQPDDYDRIRFAVIKLSEGDMDKLREWIRGANSDWRDVLIAAGFGWDVEAHRHWLPESDD